MTVAAPVLHPRRPDVELLAPGAPINQRILGRLKRLSISQMWVEHDATADLDELLDPQMGRSQVGVYQKLKEDFGKLAVQTVSIGCIQAYRQAILDLVCELMSNKAVAGLSELLHGGPREIFAHSSSVAYLSVLTGLRLETYLVHQRKSLSVEHARDVTNLGIGAMLHDIGKLREETDLRHWHEAALPHDGAKEELRAYRAHPEIGYQMLRHSRAPASATQVVLTHHQRFDGGGFPDMTRVTAGRHVGAQHGRKIHIFSRIVAAANTLDNLVRAQRHKKHPPVAALAALADARFDGWFDPVVRDAMLRHLPPFTIGTRVILSDQRPAAVAAPNIAQPCRPLVRLLAEDQRRPDGSYPLIDLHQDRDLHIAVCQGVDVQRYLFTLPEPGPPWRESAPDIVPTRASA